MKAVELATGLGHENFKCSDGWLARFRTRRGIVCRTIRGEAHGVDTDRLDECRSTVLEEIIDHYAAKDIFNLDETGLFLRVQQGCSLVFKNEDGRDVKQDKTRITLVPCCNMDGSEKFKMLILGRSQNPRANKGIKQMPVVWMANKKAWMTSVIFSTYLKKWDRQLIRENLNP